MLGELFKPVKAVNGNNRHKSNGNHQVWSLLFIIFYYYPHSMHLFYIFDTHVPSCLVWKLHRSFLKPALLTNVW
jgi:hypothetical protein